jgi:hypothetical protein
VVALGAPLLAGSSGPHAVSTREAPAVMVAVSAMAADVRRRDGADMTSSPWNALVVAAHGVLRRACPFNVLALFGGCHGRATGARDLSG